MAKKKVYGNKFSFKGWNFKGWFIGNWSTLKELLKVGIPFIVGIVATNNPLWIGLITIGGKFLMDLGHYYYKEFSN